MKVNQLKQFKEINAKADLLTRQCFEVNLFMSCTTPWVRFGLKHFEFIRNWFGYQVSTIDHNPAKMILTRNKLFSKGIKVVGKTF